VSGAIPGTLGDRVDAVSGRILDRIGLGTGWGYHYSGPPAPVLQGAVGRRTGVRSPARPAVVHRRLVVPHGGTPSLTAPRPGDWLLLERLVWPAERAAGGEAASEPFTRLAAGVDALYRLGGLGDGLPGLTARLRELGLADTDGLQADLGAGGGTLPPRELVNAVLGAVAGALLGLGLLSARELREVRTWADDPQAATPAPTLVAAWGRRPAGQPTP